MPLFTVGGKFPPTAADIERLAKYSRGKKIFDGRLYEVFERASDILKDTPHAKQLEKLYIAVNLMDVLLTKVADLMTGEAPSFESGLPDASPQQKRLNSIVEENEIIQTIHESVIGCGYRGDSYLKTYYDYRQDLSEVPKDEKGNPLVKTKKEAIIEPVDPAYIFPEFSRGSRKRVKAINIAWVELIEVDNTLLGVFVNGSKTSLVPYLNVERHVPGFIFYERYKMKQTSVDDRFGVPITIYTIIEKVDSSSDVVSTGLNRIPVHHIPYKATDDSYYGISGIEKIESVLAAINDRICQIDFILWKHSDPTAYGPELEGEEVRMGGKYIPVRKDEQTPGYMTWDSQLDGAFRELDLLLSLVFQMSETPQWVFGESVSGLGQKGGSGTSHTDASAIRQRFFPLISKVKRVRNHVDRAVRDALWTAMELENYANEDVDGFEKYEPIYPTINWRDGIPRDEKTEAEVMALRLNGKPTIDQVGAIKRLDEVDDEKAREIISRIEDDEKAANGFVDSSIFNSEDGGGS